jgi:uncharacterized protein YjiS (DUF1127 family)
LPAVPTPLACRFHAASNSGFHGHARCSSHAAVETADYQTTIIEPMRNAMSISSEDIGPVAVGTRASYRSIGNGGISMFAAAMRCIAQWHRERADMALLHRMTDRDLRDIGLSRTDVHAIAQGVHRVSDYLS